MAIKLTTAEIKARAVIVGELELKYAELGTAISALNGVLEEARDWAENVTSRCRDEFNDKSEKWQEGERGTEAEEWIAGLEGLEIEEVDQLDDEVSTTLNDYPTGPGE